jgi:hypothetical protein
LNRHIYCWKEAVHIDKELVRVARITTNRIADESDQFGLGNRKIRKVGVLLKRAVELRDSMS